MKKFISIPLLLIFIFSTVGVIARSYCCDAEIMKSKNCCAKKNNNCCRHQVKLLKLQDDFVANSPVYIDPHQSLFSAIPAEPSFIHFSTGFSSVNFHRDHSPPGRSYDLLLFIRSFRI